MNFLFLLLSIPLLIACGKPPNQIDPAFQPLYDQFIVQANKAGLELDNDQGMVIQFDKIEQAPKSAITLAECLKLGNGYRTIIVNSTSWYSLSSIAQTILIYHELGHCVLCEDHVDQSAAIMNAYINNPLSHKAELSQMIDQLFKDRRSCL